MVAYAKDDGELLVDTVTTVGNQTQPVTTTLADGKHYVVAWTDEVTDAYAIHARIYANDGSPAGPDILVDAAGATFERVRSVAALEGGGFVVAWQTTANGNDAQLRVFDATGAPATAAMNAPGPSADSEYDPSVAGLKGGGFVVSYQTADSELVGVGAQVYDSAYHRAGGPIAVNTQQAGFQSGGKAIGLKGPDGGFVITWTDSTTFTDGSGSAARAQRFDASGAKLGKEFAVNTATLGSQAVVDAFALDGGGFGVHYTTTIQGQGGFRSEVQLFDAGGRLFGAEHELGVQGSQIARLADGSYVGVYSNDSAGGDVSLQHYSADFTKIGAAEIVNGSLAGRQNFADVTAIGNGFVVVYQTGDTTSDGDGSGVLMQRFDALSRHGTPGPDTLTAPDDRGWLIVGGGGDDTITGGAGDDRLTGGAGDDTIRGLGGKDQLIGGAGDDLLVAGGGDDRMTGGDGADTLVSGAGVETMIGGGGADTFVLSAEDVSLQRQSSGIDARILDFSQLQGDRIDLSAIDATGAPGSAFTFIGSDAFHHVAGELRVQQSGGVIFVQADVDGEGHADLIIRVDHATSLTAADFIL